VTVAAQKVIPITALALYARTRMKSARHNANYLHEQLGRAMTGFAFKNFVLARRLRPLAVDLVKAMLIHPRTNKPTWRPPRGAAEFVELLAMLVIHWAVPKGEPNAGDGYRGLHASAEEIAEALGICKNQWARGPYIRDGHVISRGGAKEWLQHHRLIAVYATTKVNPAGWVSRDGKPIKFREDRYYIEPGPALLQLLGMHRRRVTRNRRRLLAAFHDLGSKGSGSLFSLRENILPPHRARARKRGTPIIRQCQLMPPVLDGVGSGKTRSRRVAQDAPPADGRHAPCSDSSQNNSKPDGHEGRAFAEGGGDLAASRQSEPAAPEAAQTPATNSATSADRGAAPAAPPDPIAALIAATLAKVDPARSMRELARPPTRPPSPNGPELAPSTGEVLGAIGGADVETLIIRLGASERERAAELARLKAKTRIGPAGPRPPAPPAVPIGALVSGLFGDRTPAEEAENKRRRDLAVKRAREEAERENAPIADVDDGVGAGPGGDDSDGET
jgi:hypothetical protein